MSEKILSLDIETTGLDARIHEVTIVCTFDGQQSRSYHFKKPYMPAIVNEQGDFVTCRTPEVCSRLSRRPAGHEEAVDVQGCDEAESDAKAKKDEAGGAVLGQCRACERWHERNRAELMLAMDAADYLAGYNIILFDLPFLRKQWRVPDSRYQRWLDKALDPFSVAKEVIGQWLSLNKMLQANALPCKSAQGAQAVEFVRRSEWNQLEQYCADDTALSHRLLMRDPIRFPTGIDAIMRLERSDKTGRLRVVLRYTSPDRAGEDGGGAGHTRRRRLVITTTSTRRRGNRKVAEQEAARRNALETHRGVLEKREEGEGGREEQPDDDEA